MTPSFQGKKIANGGLTLSTPRQWTQDEIDWMLQKKKEGHSIAELAQLLQRTQVSVQVKLKRLSKESDKYNTKHRESKYAANQSFLDLVQPSSVLDLFAGNSWYAGRVQNLVTNDKSDQFATDYSMDALKLLSKFFLDGRKFDLIDLDPYGSAYECFDFALRLSKKALVVSFGEFGHARWKRLDFVRDRYGINQLSEFVPDKFVGEVQRIGRLHKKLLTPTDSLQYGNFLRVHFQIEQIKVTEQWEKH